MINVRNSFGDLDMIKLLILESKISELKEIIVKTNLVDHHCNCSKCDIEVEEEHYYQCPHCYSEAIGCHRDSNDPDLIVCNHCNQSFVHRVLLQEIKYLAIKIKCSQ